jgi:hypothetical protein
MNKEKLVTLFKQCCDNNDFHKQMGYTWDESHNYSSSIPNNGIITEVPSDIADFLDKSGYNRHELGEDLYYIRKHRLFEFDGQPPLKLYSATLPINTFLRDEYITIGKAIPIQSEAPYTEWKEVKTWYGKKKHKDVRVTRDFHIRNINVSISNVKELYDGENITNVNYSKLRHYNANDVIVINDINYKEDYDDYQFEGKRAKTIWMNAESFISEEAKTLDEFKRARVDVNGGLLRFGDIACWLSLDEYKELEQYYIGSVLKSQEVILDKRLKETK